MEITAESCHASSAGTPWDWPQVEYYIDCFMSKVNEIAAGAMRRLATEV